VSLEKITKTAPLFAVAILVVVVIAIFLSDQADQDRGNAKVASTGNQSSVNTGSSQSQAVGSETTIASPQIASPQQGSAVNSPATSTEQAANANDKKPGAVSAPMLSNLIAGLEKKVAADPDNTGTRMLLAQTYAEVGEVEKGLQILRDLKAKEPENLKIDLVLASVLGKSNNPAELNEALKLLVVVEQRDESQIGPVLLQRGRLYMKMGETESAREEWKQAITRLPEGSGYRKQAEIELARLN